MKKITALLLMMAVLSAAGSLFSPALAEPAVFSFDRSSFLYYPSLIQWEKSDVPLLPIVDMVTKQSQFKTKN